MAKKKDEPETEFTDQLLREDAPAAKDKGKPYSIGYDAARNGSDYTANPYDEDPDRAEWYRGFDDQKSEGGLDFTTENE